MHSNCEIFLCIVANKQMKYTGFINLSGDKEGTVTDHYQAHLKVSLLLKVQQHHPVVMRTYNRLFPAAHETSEHPGALQSEADMTEGLTTTQNKTMPSV